MADRSSAKIFRTDSQSKNIELVQEFDHPIGLLKDKDLLSDKPGRSKDRKGRGKHSYSQGVSPSKQIMLNFTNVIAQILDKGRTMDRMDEIILICPPAMLGLLRTHLNASTRKMVIASLKKDLVKLSGANLKSTVSKLIAEI